MAFLKHKIFSCIDSNIMPSAALRVGLYYTAAHIFELGVVDVRLTWTMVNTHVKCGKLRTFRRPNLIVNNHMHCPRLPYTNLGRFKRIMLTVVEQKCIKSKNYNLKKRKVIEKKFNRPRQDSNLQPPDPKSGALSIALLGLC